MRALLPLFLVIGALVLIFMLVAGTGAILGRLAPERVSFAYTSRFEGSRDEIWSRFGLPAQRTEVRERADGVKYEARQGETEGSLVLLYEPPSRIIRHHAWPNTETWNIVTLTAVQGGTVVRVEESAILRGGWHRLLFPRQMKGWAQEILREYARDAGQPHPRIVPDGSPALAFTPFTDRAARAVPLDHPVAARSLAGKPALRSKDSGTHPKPLPVVSRPADTSAEELPRLGEYVYVDELPVLITAVKPTYPDIARDASVDGTVMVQALVGKDGHVKDAKVVKSIPMLDASALTAVKQFVFKPALANNRPVAVWVAVPIRFSLN